MQRVTLIQEVACGRVTAALGFIALVAACSMPETSIPPPRVIPPAAFDQAAFGGAPPSREGLARWWLTWKDPLLDHLVEEALAANTDIRAAQARVAEARSFVTIAESALYPTVAANGSVWGGEVAWRSSTLDLVPGLGPGVDSHLGGLAASWEPDVFGGRREDVQAAGAVAASAEEQLNGAHMIVAADIAENYLEARGLQRRLTALDASITTLEQLARYAQARYEAGQALAYDVELVRERLDTLRGKRPPLVSLLDMRRRRLAVLCGRTPEMAEPLPTERRAFVVPPPPAGQMPADVLERRPDVRGRAALVRARAAQLRSAETDLLPRFQIEFLGQDGHLHFQGIPGLAGTAGLVGLSANLPIFTAGRIRANIAANDARLEQAAADYDKAVLQALEDVENAYGLRHGLDQRRIALTQALARARYNEEVSAGLYEGGRKTLQDVLDSRINSLNSEDELIQAKMGQATATVQLYRALGGGW